jgi:arabinosaccharide transport system substrate-binding protein
MVEKFPYGKAPFWLLVVAVTASLLRVIVATKRPDRADLILVTLSPAHYETYKKAIPEFERQRGIKVQLQFASSRSMQSRFENAMLDGSDVPDLVELIEGSMGFFTRGPREDIGLLDLTDRINESGLDRRLVQSRFSLWSNEGRIYAIPHDVHPVMLAYRRDLIEQLGIDVQKLDTWDKFVEEGRRVTRDNDGDGIIDQYMLDLSADGGWGIVSLLLQRGGQLFDSAGDVVFNDDLTADVIAWLLRQSFGPQKIAYDADPAVQTGQSLIKALTDGLVLFVWTPDWRSRMLEDDAPRLRGKMALMPLPAWTKGGRRTSVWGGTGLTITRQTKHPDWAWDLANFLYFDPNEIGSRFARTNIIPVLSDAWDLPEINAPNPYYSNQRIGRLYADLAPSTPPRYMTALNRVAEIQLQLAYNRCTAYYKRNGEDGLLPEIRHELDRVADDVNLRVARAQALARSGSE